MTTDKHPIPDDLLTDHIAVLAKTGAGKTYGGKGIVERLLRRELRVCIIDPKNAWWGLKSSPDGKSPGFAIVVFGGPKADVPLLATHGKILGEAIATGHLSCIICTKGMSEGDRIRFLTDFFQTLDQKNTQPLHLVLDEAHMMAPQKPLGEMQRLTHYTSELVSGGRGMGFRILLLSQRPARLNKDVLTQCETLIAMRMTGIQDRDAVKSWIHDQADMETGKDIVASLTGLPDGEGWLWSPKHNILKRFKFPRITTYDNSATTKNSGADERAKLAPVDLAVLEQKLGSAKTELDARDPAKLKARIAELEKQVAAKPAAAATRTDAKADNTRIRSEGYNAGYAAAKKEEFQVSKARNKLIVAYNKAMEARWAALEKIVAARPEPLPTDEPIVPAPADTAGVPAPPISTAIRDNPPPRPKPTAPVVAGDLSGPERKIMAALAEWKAMGFDRPTRPQLAALCNYHPRTPSFTNPLGSLRTAGLIDHGGGDVWLTDAGVGSVEIPTIPDIETLHDKLRGAMDGPQRKIFDFLVPHGQEPLTRQALADGVGYHVRTPSFTNPLGALRTREILDYGTGTVFLRPWVFMERA
jgi:hypothetical protein